MCGTVAIDAIPRDGVELECFFFSFFLPPPFPLFFFSLPLLTWRLLVKQAAY